MNEQILYDEDLKVLDNFQIAAQSALDAIQGIIDNSWNELKENFDPCKTRQHEQLVAVMENFRENFIEYNDVLESFHLEGDE